MGFISAPHIDTYRKNDIGASFSSVFSRNPIARSRLVEEEPAVEGREGRERDGNAARVETRGARDGDRASEAVGPTAEKAA